MFNFLVIILFFFLSSCQYSEKKMGEVVRLNLLHDPSTIDPRKARSLSDKILVSMLFDGLMRLNPEGIIAPSLAEKIEVDEEQKIYRFTLREAYWSNGDKIVPGDFVYSWTSSLLPESVSEASLALFCIEGAEEIKKGELPPSCLGVRQVETNVLEVRLKEPFSYFLELLCSPVFFPIHRENTEKTCGPFVLSSWRHNDEIILEKNKNYWDASSVYIPKISLIIVAEETELLLFEKGELDWAGSPLSCIPTDAIQRCTKQGKMHFFPIDGTSFFRFNVEKKPFDDLEVRRAFSMAIDKQILCSNVLEGMQIAASSFVPAFSHKLESFMFEHPVEEFCPVTLLYASSNRAQLIAQAVQGQIKEKLGVHVSLEACEPKVYYTRLKKGEYQMALGSWIADFHDPESFLGVFSTKNSPSNHTNWENNEYKQLLEKAKKETGICRETTLRACDAILQKDVPIVPLFYYQGIYLKNPLLEGVIVSPLGMLDFKWAYLSNTKKN